MSKRCHIIDVACSGDSRIAMKEEEKVNKYRDLGIEIKALWHMKRVTTTPVVIGALGMFRDRLEKYLEDIHVGLKGYNAEICAISISQNSEKSSRMLRWLVTARSRLAGKLL
mgnify:CR=1 FL=1